jgi:hypothetical protein
MTKEFSYIPADNGRIEQWRDTDKFGYPEAEFTHAVTDEEWELFSGSEEVMAFVDGKIAPWAAPAIPYAPPPPPEPPPSIIPVPKSISMRQATRTDRKS